MSMTGKYDTSCNIGRKKSPAHKASGAVDSLLGLFRGGLRVLLLLEDLIAAGPALSVQMGHAFWERVVITFRRSIMVMPNAT